MKKYLVSKNGKIVKVGDKLVIGELYLKSFFYGDHVSTAVDDKNNAWITGQSSDGFLGLGENVTTTNGKFTRIGKKFKQVFNFMGLDPRGNIWTWGENGAGSLGLGIEDEGHIEYFPTLITGLDVKFKKVGYASNSYYALGENNRLWAWGENSVGQLGFGEGDTDNRNSPEMITDPDIEIKDFICGSNFLVILDFNDNLYVCGSKLGESGNYNGFETIEFEGNIQSISAGQNWIMVLDTDGNGHGMGTGGSGRLGNGSQTSKTSLTPVTMPQGVSFTKIVAGTGSTHALDTNNKIWSWGSNWHGTLGIGTSGEGTEKLEPTLVEEPDIDFVDVFAAPAICFARDINNNVYGTGSNSNGRLGTGTGTSIFTKIIY